MMNNRLIGTKSSGKMGKCFISLLRDRRCLLKGALFLLCALTYLAACAPAPSQKPRTFVRKDCLECHTKFRDTYLKMKNVHAVVRENK